MKKQLILALSLLIIILILIFLTFYFRTAITGEVTITDSIVNKYSYTTAICDGNKTCQDNIVECEGKNIIKISPISGAVVQHDKDWQDPRNNNTNELCNRY